ncbi:ankyrin repeat-containing domain protein [Choanephora cucurbitarum]|nr:ankyrin repeat-containing domain protein [Choanephora cucurbitarum]
MDLGNKRPADDLSQSQSNKRSKSMDEQDVDVFEYISLDSLDIKALYKYIRSKDSDVHILNKEGYSLLYLAAYNKNLEALRILLLQPNMDVNRLNGPHHEIALHAACSKGLYDGIELLVENGSELNTKDSLGHTPLTNAIFSGSLACVELLLSTERGVDVSVIDEQGNNLLHLAVTNDFTECIPLLAKKGVLVDEHNHRGLSPLAIAISFGYIETAIALIDNGADVNGRTRFATVLHQAVMWNRIEIVKKLIEHNCNPNVVNLLEETPLYLAVQQRKIDIVQCLLDAKADPCYMPDQPENTTNLPLLYAANHGYTEMSKLLITPKTSTFFVQVSVDMSARAGYPATEKSLAEELTQRSLDKEPATTNNDEKESDDAVFASLFNTFSDEEQQ